MCGIAGVHSPGADSLLSIERLEAMISVLGHRGPDESGIYLDNSVGLGHTRLSIVDLAGGTQPIHNEDETLWIVYNGEIYNHKELREDLVKRGHDFYTNTDTEVILHLFEDSGPACLDKLNGQFAFAIWDSKTEELFLARDRVGIRPLHYAVRNGCFLFASEIKSLFASDIIPREIDPVALDHVFTFWTTLPGETHFKGVLELRPGHYMTVSGSTIETTQYWDFPFARKTEELDWPIEDLCSEVDRLLHDAVRIRLRADVPVGSYLSGGLDSSGVTAIVSGDFDSDVRTYGIEFEEEAFDEGSFQRLAVQHLDVDHRRAFASNKRIGAYLRDVIWHVEKPILRTAPIPMFLLAKLVRQEGRKVVLTGEGADEVFGGYNIFREAKIRRFWSKQPESRLRPALLGKIYPYIFDDPKLASTTQSFFGKDLGGTDDPLFSHRIRWNNTSRVRTFFSSDIRSLTDSESGYDAVVEQLPDSFSEWDPFAQSQYLETKIFMSNYLLSSQGDRMAMAHSVEIRLPYLDHRLIEFLGRIPSKWKIRGLREKYLLKRILHPHLPQTIVNRNKHPFRAPIAQTLLGNAAPAYVEELLSERCLRASGLFDTPKVNRLVQKLRRVTKQSEVDNMALVGILSTQIVHSHFIQDFPLPNGRSADLDLCFDKRTLSG